MPILMKPLKTFEIVIINFYVRSPFVYVIKVKKRLEDIPSIIFFLRFFIPITLVFYNGFLPDHQMD